MKNTINKKKLICLLLVLIMAVTAGIALTGCGDNVTSKSSKTKTVTDCVGRKVEIPDDPQRVVCLYATAAHIMAMLDEQDKMVGVPNGVKSDVLMQMKCNNLDELSVPAQSGTINVEELLSLDADLVLVKSTKAEDKAQTEQLKKLNIPYVVVDYYSISDQRKAIKLMGKIFNDEDKASKYIAFFDKTINMVKERLKDVKDSEKPKVYHSVNEAIRTDSKDDICAEIMETAGVKDISVDKDLVSDGEKIYTTLEEIYKWNPDAIIANESSVTEYITTDSKWSGLSAVKNKKVYTLPVGATRWCHPGSMEAHMGVLAVAEKFYPEKFKDIDMNKYVKDYYKEYFDLNLSSDTVKNILAVEGMRKSNSANQSNN